MGKRSNFDRVPRDFYPTPESAVRPLLAHLPEGFTFSEPCAGDGRLITHLVNGGGSCVAASDIEPRGFGITEASYEEAPVSGDWVITNPPWDRKLLHPMIEHFSGLLPTWLLFDADWMHTKQSIPYLPLLRKVVSVGRVKWIEDSPHTGKDNCCWYLFDQSDNSQTRFYGRT